MSFHPNSLKVLTKQVDYKQQILNYRCGNKNKP